MRGTGMNENDSKETTLYLTLRLGDELLALDVSRVREVLDLCPITRVPKTAEYMRGVINIRGNVLPVLDLRSRFEMDAREATVASRIVVLEVDINGNRVMVSVLADSVHEVVEIKSEHIGPPPRVGDKWRIDYIKGIGKQNDNFLLLLNTDRVFSSENMESMLPKKQFDSSEEE